MSPPPSVLVLRLSSLGDVLFAVPAIQVLQASGAVGSLAWLVEDRAAALVRDLIEVDEVIVFPRRRRAAWPAHFARLLRRRDDVVLDMQCNLKSRLQRLFLRGGRHIGYAPPVAREGGERGLDELHTPPPGARHRIAAHLSLLTRLGVTPPRTAPRPVLRIPDAARARAREVIDGARGDGPVIVLHPGTSAFGAFKRWDPARFAELGARLQRERGARLVVTGGPDEGDLVQRARTPGDTAPAPSGLVDLAALLEQADLLVAADSLPLHLANGLGTPVVGLYGPKDPAVNGPAFDRSEVVRAGVHCSPCTLRRCADRICMRRLEVDAVSAACARLLDDARSRGGATG